MTITSALSSLSRPTLSSWPTQLDVHIHVRLRR